MSDEAVKVEEKPTPEPIKLFGRDTEVSKQMGAEHKDLPLWSGSRFPFQGSVHELTVEEASQNEGRKYKGSFRIIQGVAGAGGMMSILFGGGGNGPLAEYVAHSPQAVADALTKDAEALLVEMLSWAQEAQAKGNEYDDIDTFETFKVFGLKFVRDERQPDGHLRFHYETSDPTSVNFFGIALTTGTAAGGIRWWRAKPWGDGEDPDDSFCSNEPESVVAQALQWVQRQGILPGDDLDKEVSDKIWPKYGTPEPTG